jgi:hypothetical protein
VVSQTKGSPLVRRDSPNKELGHLWFDAED